MIELSIGSVLPCCIFNSPSTPEERIWRWILRDLAAAGQEPALSCEVWRVAEGRKGKGVEIGPGDKETRRQEGKRPVIRPRS